MITDVNGIKDVLAETIGIERDALENISGNDDLRSHGLNSISCIELIVKLEQENEITISDEDLLIDNVCTINSIYNLLEKYK